MPRRWAAASRWSSTGLRSRDRSRCRRRRCCGCRSGWSTPTTSSPTGRRRWTEAYLVEEQVREQRLPRLHGIGVEVGDAGVAQDLLVDQELAAEALRRARQDRVRGVGDDLDRKSTRLNSSHVKISYAVFCLK